MARSSARPRSRCRSSLALWRWSCRPRARRKVSPRLRASWLARRACVGARRTSKQRLCCLFAAEKELPTMAEDEHEPDAPAPAADDDTTRAPWAPPSPEARAAARPAKDALKDAL